MTTALRNTNSNLDQIFSALSDSTRRAILERLAGGQASVSELAAPFEISLPAISKHLSVLENANLLVREKDGRVRRCTLNAEPMKNAAEWIARYKDFWHDQFDALDEYLSQPTAQEDENNG